MVSPWSHSQDRSILRLHQSSCCITHQCSNLPRPTLSKHKLDATQQLCTDSKLCIRDTFRRPRIDIGGRIEHASSRQRLNICQVSGGAYIEMLVSAHAKSRCINGACIVRWKAITWAAESTVPVFVVDIMAEAQAVRRSEAGLKEEDNGEHKDLELHV